jgi:ABC-type phosphate transport system substrate-binding protein
MKTKVSLVAAAVAMAVGSQAFAFGPTVAPDITINIGGGSAQGGAFLAFAEKLMTTGFDVYTDAACGTQGANYRAVFGTIASTLPNGTAMPANLVGKKLYITYANNGGTFKNGIDGLVRSHAIDVQQFLNNSTACPSGSATQYTVTNAALTTTNVPLIGLSDEEIGLFSGVNVPAGSSAIKASELTSITQQPIYENVFGIAINSLLAAQKTNFTKAEVAAIYSGNYNDWSQLGLPAGPITFINRAAGSGSKAAFNEFFLNNPGSFAEGGSVPPNVIATSKGNCGAPATHGSGSYDNTTGGDCAESSNGNVKAGLNNANTAGVRALGILGLEFQPGSSDHFSFASLDGVVVNGVTAKTCGNAVANAFEPANVVSGAYPLFYTNSLQFRNADHTGTGTNKTFIDAFLVVATDPATEVSVPGVLLDPLVVGAPAGNPYDDCITKGTHNGNSQAPLQLQF